MVEIKNRSRRRADWIKGLIFVMSRKICMLYELETVKERGKIISSSAVLRVYMNIEITD